MELDNEKTIVSKEAKIQQENSIRRKNYIDSNPMASFQEKILTEGAELGAGIMTKQDQFFYRVPSYFKGMLGRTLFDELQDILLLIKEINDDYQGEKVEEVEFLLRDNDLANELIELSFPWAEKYSKARAEKENPKDDGNPLKKYTRIRNEIMDFLVPLVDRQKNANSYLIHPLIYCIRWHLYNLIWAEYVQFEFDGYSAAIDFSLLFDRFDYVDGFVNSLNKIIAIDKLYNEEKFRYFLNGFCANAEIPVEISSLSDDEKREHLCFLGTNIIAMRPFLLRNFDPLKTIIKIADEIFIAWEWAAHFGIGSVTILQTEEDFIKRYRSGSSIGLMLNVAATGFFMLPNSLWLNTEYFLQEKNSRALDLNYLLLDRIHEILFSFYEQIDIDAIIRRFEEKKTDNQNEYFQAEFIAATSQRYLAEDKTPPEDDNRQKCIRLKPVRSLELFNILENRLLCEITQGKGSEICLYRPGGKKIRLGHHKRNDYLSTWKIREIVKRLNISVEEWFAALKAKKDSY